MSEKEKLEMIKKRREEYNKRASKSYSESRKTYKGFRTNYGQIGRVLNPFGSTQVIRQVRTTQFIKKKRPDVLDTNIW